MWPRRRLSTQGTDVAAHVPHGVHRRVGGARRLRGGLGGAAVPGGPRRQLCDHGRGVARRRRRADRVRRRIPEKNEAAVIRKAIFTSLAVAAPRAALACPVCFGNSDSPLAIATNMGIIAMLVVVAGVLGGFATFF